MIEIKTGNIPCYVYVSDVLNHTHFKSIILNSIKNYGIFGIYTGERVGIHTGERDLGQSIFNTDWHLSDNLHSENNEYSSIINNIITDAQIRRRPVRVKGPPRPARGSAGYYIFVILIVI